MFLDTHRAIGGRLRQDYAAHGITNSHLVIEVFAGLTGGAITITIWRRRIAALVEELISSERGRRHLY